MLIIICGLPGSGKTTLARALSKKIGAEHVSSDILRKELFPNPTYSEKEKQSVYDEMVRRAARALSEGKVVVADATFHKKSNRECFLGLTAGKTAIILVELDEDETRKRLGKRKMGGPSDADYDVYKKLKSAFEPIGERHLVVDTMKPLKERIAKILEFIGWADG